MSAVSDKHLEGLHKQVLRTPIVRAAGRFKMMDHSRQSSLSGLILQRYEMHQCFEEKRERTKGRQTSGQN